jgi:hypothetical protein
MRDICKRVAKTLLPAKKYKKRVNKKICSKVLTLYVFYSRSVDTAGGPQQPSQMLQAKARKVLQSKLAENAVKDTR